MHVFAYADAKVDVDVYVHVHVYEYEYACICMHMQLHVHACIRTNMCAIVCICIYMYKLIHVCLYNCIAVHLCIYTNELTHKQQQTPTRIDNLGQYGHATRQRGRRGRNRLVVSEARQRACAQGGSTSDCTPFRHAPTRMDAPISNWCETNPNSRHLPDNAGRAGMRGR